MLGLSPFGGGGGEAMVNSFLKPILERLNRDISSI